MELFWILLNFVSIFNKFRFPNLYSNKLFFWSTSFYINFIEQFFFLEENISTWEDIYISFKYKLSVNLNR